MAPVPGERELDEVLHRAQAALRRQESEIAEVLAGVDRARSLTERARVEIEQERAQDAAERRDPLLRIGEQMGRDVRRAGSHGAELRHAEDHVLAADAPRPVQRGTGAFQPYGERDGQQHRREQDQARKRARDVHRPLHVSPRAP